MSNGISIRREGWTEVVLFLLVTVVISFVWVTNGMHVSYLASIFGLGVGLSVYFVDRLSLRPLIELPVVLVLCILLAVFVVEEALISGAVAACVAITAAKAYDVYL
ncbi:hypothetical protein ACT4ML_11440 [Natrinema sp. LN54]|uniref:hypothetical protein n=1 Tax=Natrinema sp. LN54 TaxID=3458705 RepID=UPI004035B442